MEDVLKKTYTFSVDGSQVSVFKEGNKVSLKNGVRDKTSNVIAMSAPSLAS